jgi:thiamine biosynthesis protein ThiI
MNCILLRYGEIGIKSWRVRRRMENLLIKNLSASLWRKKLKIDRIYRAHGRIIIYCNKVDKACEALKRVFGMVSLSPALESEIEIKNLKKASLAIYRKFARGKSSFRISARRITKSIDLTSQEINRLLGSYLQEKTGAKVKLKNPELNLGIEIIEQNSYIFLKTFRGPGGLPLGSQGKIICLLSGGFDSAVASWLAMKRGCEPIFLYFDNSPFTDAKTKRRAIAVARCLAKEWGCGVELRLLCIPQGKNLKEVKKVAGRYTCIICKRLMCRIAERIASEEKADAILTGESIGQVASQTLENIKAIDASVGIPIFRPLIGLGKEEIISLAKQIGTYDTSLMKVKQCSAVPKHPATRSRVEVIERIEKKLEIEKMIEYSLKKSNQAKI